jgi:CheY-like chemotaxis protein
MFLEMKNVLLIDDDPICNIISTKIIQQLGAFHEIRTALHGEEALSLIRGDKEELYIPDMILLDLNMPVLDGFGFMEALKNIRLPRKEVIRIIIVTTSNHPKDVEKAMELGAAGYIVKPMTTENLTPFTTFTE